jgi:precorrin-6B methylase 2
LLAGSKPTLSARLEAILSLLEPCHSLADIATDHALLPIAAVARGLCERAVAIDLREAPLVEARRNVERAGLGERIALLRGDGLLPLLSQPTEAVVIAGVSGALVVRMLEAVQSLKSGLNQLVLQPNTDLAHVRAWARKNVQSVLCWSAAGSSPLVPTSRAKVMTPPIVCPGSASNSWTRSARGCSLSEVKPRCDRLRRNAND